MALTRKLTKRKREISLIRDGSEINVRDALERFASAIRSARQSAEHERAAAEAYRDCVDRGATIKAHHWKYQAKADGVRARDEAARAASVARDLVLWALADWRPTLDVTGSGLTRDELACLAQVVGVLDVPVVMSDDIPF